MDLFQLLNSLLLVLLTMYVIKYSCDSFEEASDYLGNEVYKMRPGVRGATLEAIASSLPELFTTFFLLFVYNNIDGFSAGVATCAGSAVFNAAVIPAVCILTVTLRGVKGKTVDTVPLLRSTILRDGFFFLLAEIVLIFFLAKTSLSWWMGAALIGIYLVYFTVLMQGLGDEDEEEESEEESEEEGESTRGLIGSILTFDFNQVIFQGQDLNKERAWTVLTLATATIGCACYFLALAIDISAEALGVPMYFTAVILGAAATSVPDTLLSVGDAMKGDYDDAVANAVGSNIFDICVALGLPLLAYGLIYGDVSLSGSVGSSSNVQELRIALVVVTFFILGLFLTARQNRDDAQRVILNVGQTQGWLLGTVYLGWTIFILGRAFEWAWLSNLLNV